MLADVGVVAFGTALFVTTNKASHNAIVLIDALAWSLASPVVHAVHGRPGVGRSQPASALVASPIAERLWAPRPPVARQPEEDSDPTPALCGAVNGLVGAAVGLISATILDVAILAHPHDDASGAGGRARRGSMVFSHP